MITLCDLNPQEEGRVISIDADEALKQRLFSFGLRKGSHIKVKAISLAKKTIEVEVGSTLMALRHCEARQIGIER